MAERRVWTYRPNQPRGSTAHHLLLSALAHRFSPEATPQPVIVSLTDLSNDTGLTPREAIVALRELAHKRLITIAPVPQLADIGRERVYVVWWEPTPE